MDALEELTRLRALDDPVVVGRRQRHHPADGVAADGVLGGALVLRRVLHGADADDRALAAHQARHGVVGADRARVGEGERRPGEVLDGELGVARLAHDVLVAGPERGEVHRLGALDVGHEELAGAVLLLHVDREPEVDVGRGDLGGLAVDHVEADVHLRHRLEGLDQRVADQVGERHLAAAGAGQVVVDDDPVVPEQLDRDRPDRGRGGDGQGVVHVGDGAGGRAAEHGVRRLVARAAAGAGASFSLGTGRSVPLAGSAALLSGRGVARGAGFASAACSPRPGPASAEVFAAGAGLGGRPARPGACSAGACSAGAAAGRGLRGRGGAVARAAPVARAGLLEVRRPARVHAARITGELVVHLLDEPLVGSEVGGGVWL